MSIQSVYVTYFEKSGKNFLKEAEGSRAREIEETFNRFCLKANERTSAVKSKEEEFEGAL